MLPDGGTDPGLARIIRPGKKTNPGALGSSHDIRHFRTLWVGHRAGGTLSSPDPRRKSLPPVPPFHPMGHGSFGR